MNIYAACVIGAVLSFLVAFLSGFVIIPLLRKLKFGQTILDIGPKWHQKKQGTPTMGGFLFILSTLISFGAVLFADKRLGGHLIYSSEILAWQMKMKLFGGLIMALGFAFIGFLDDYIKVVKKRNLGLTVLQKTALQFILGLGYLLMLFINDPTGSMFVPFLGTIETGVGFWAIGLAVIYCTVNAVNFTDGVDGLCGSVTFAAAISFVAVAALRSCFGISLLSACLAGGLLGYLIWNHYPAKVMMGDLGSMFLGGLVVAFSYAVDCPLIILLIGIVYVIEFSSDIIQIIYFKATHGKRVFKMAPLHHHLEMSGWKEDKIVGVFTFIGALGGTAATALVYFGNLR